MKKVVTKLKVGDAGRKKGPGRPRPAPTPDVVGRIQKFVEGNSGSQNSSMTKIKEKFNRTRATAGCGLAKDIKLVSLREGRREKLSGKNVKDRLEFSRKRQYMA